MEVYDLNKDTLYVDPVNPHQAVDFASFIYDECLYVMGGAVKEKMFSNQIHMLDLKRGVWYEQENTIPAEWCGRMNGILVGDKVYFLVVTVQHRCGLQLVMTCGQENGNGYVI